MSDLRFGRTSPDSTPVPTAFRTMTDLRRANAAAGMHFFSPDAMRWFQSRTCGRLMDGRYFVTSERHGWDAPRLYSIRLAEPDASMTTVALQAYDSADKATRAIRRLIAEGC